jgi:hypothetical protein
MAAGVRIKIKRKAGAFVNGDLNAGELGLDVTNSKLYSSNDGASVYCLDTVGLTEIVQDTTPELGGNLDAKSFRITNLSAPNAGGDAANKTYVDATVQGLRWDKPVINIQLDATLNPGTPTEGDRYILTDIDHLHANFGTVTGVGNSDIVQYVTNAFVVIFDASVAGEGTAVYNANANSPYVYNGTTWVQVGGSADHGGLTGLGDDDHTQYAIISTGAGAPGSTPTRVGAIYQDSSNARIYVAKGTGSSADWQIMVSAATSDSFSNKTISADTNTIDGGTI